MKDDICYRSKGLIGVSKQCSVVTRIEALTDVRVSTSEGMLVVSSGLEAIW
jgi:hypothetical protein